MLKILRLLVLYYTNIKRGFWRYKVKATAKLTGKHIYIGGPSSVNNKTVLGDHFSTNGLMVRGSGTVKLGDFVHTGNDLLIISSNHNYKKAEYLPYDDQHEDKHVEVGRAVWIGDRVIILGGVKIGEGSIIQAGSVVVSDLPKFSIAGGNPAKVFKYRDVEHYRSLADRDKFVKIK